MFEALLQAFITQGVLPELLNIIKNHFASTGNIPTLDEVLAKLNTDADGGIKIGTDWLNSHGN